MEDGLIVTTELAVSSCPVCGSPDPIDLSTNCPGCEARPRTRTIAPVLSDVIDPLARDSRELPLMVFGATASEKALLRRVFERFVSVSLYGTYGDDHHEGVDIRDLSRFPSGTMAGIFASLLFDYFEEHDAALEEAFRVIADGGVLFTHIAPYRLTPGMDPPTITRTIQPRKGYFSYVPVEEGLPSVSVGRDWFLAALQRAGFRATRVAVGDRQSDVSLDWFVGVKPGRTPSPARRTVTPVAEAMTPSFSRMCSIPVDPAFGFRRVQIELSVPALPRRLAAAQFAEHVAGPAGSTDTVVACLQGGVVVSDDLGAHWESMPTPGTGDVELWNCFTTSTGHRLVQAGHSAAEGGTDTESEARTPIFIFDQDWQLVDQVAPAPSPWLGTRSIDEANGVIIHGEYPPNAGRFDPGFDLDNPSPEQRKLLRDSRLLRSTDGGHSWRTTLQLDWRTIRHFHTVVADPYQAGRWWASSGDRPAECCVWESVDDGLTWRDVSTPAPAVELHPSFQPRAQSVFRYTDLVVHPGELVWGADDLLGGGALADDPDVPLRRRAGARMFRSPKSAHLEPESIGYVGNPVRSIIDVGPAYLVTTEAKGGAGYCPSVLLLSKSQPYQLAPLLTIDNFAPRSTGFTYSRSSRSAKDGVFFTYRLRTDGFDGGVGILRWRVDFA